MRSLAWFAPLLVIAGCSSEDDPCAGVSSTCIGLTSGASTTEVQTALIEIPTGGTVAFGAGTFEMTTDLSLDVDGVTMIGAGKDKTVLSFAKQTSGAQGILVTGNDFRARDFAIEDTKGDSLKILGTTGVTLQNMRVEWTRGPNEANGAYGLYPVQCNKVLIEDSVVLAASDAGIYVGQSDQIIVRNNTAEYNVAGIEIENSTRADVYNNIATNNTGGILVFNLPGLDVANGAGTRVYDNQIYSNNTVNFAPPGNIVGKVPTGTGVVILAAHQVEIFRNEIRDHKAVNIGMISYVPIGAVNDPKYDQYPTAIYIHDNTLSGVSDMPTGELGAALITAIGEIRPNGPFITPDIAWDGVVDPNRTPGNPADKICIKGNGDANFINLAWPLSDATLPTESLTPHDCNLPALPAVTL
ncbi:MAG: right-handed parallel beta-helix repeat-containing protein [Deltaproteobacteria bacterium]|nr:right-handed parallel beta-helix repeat-containing protein [Deltaproteobacteria bacterium]